MIVASTSRLKRLYRQTQWFLNTDLELRPSEEVLLESLASLIHGLPTRGRLVLTTDRLVYMPMYPRFMPRMWPKVEVSIADMRSVTGRSWLRGLWGGLPGLPLFRLKLKGGGDLTFQTLFPDAGFGISKG